MVRILALVIAAGSLTGAFCQDGDKSRNMPAPPALPLYDWRGSPGECSSSGPWIMERAVTVYDTSKQERRPIAHIAAGDRLTAISYAIVTFRPGQVRMDRDVPEQGLKRGEILLTYAYRGEGYSAVWFRGRYDADFDISFTRWPDGSGCGGAHCAATYLDLGRKTWWAKVRLASGRTGWVNMDSTRFHWLRP